MSYASGTRIRFPRAIPGPATGDHPEFLLASAGEEGEIVSYDETSVFPYSVKTDSWPRSFGADETDFRLIATEAAPEQSDLGIRATCRGLGLRPGPME